ncbi:MAG: heme-binding domain-containing protein [Anaerolineae bacterium]|nr:heme-binding domain-containing protein [Anaerolineae bacterium]
MKFWRKLRALITISAGTLMVFTVIQAFPIWRYLPVMDPRNPPVRYEVQWSSAEADTLMHTICYTCHSNETEYPLYLRFAPASWIAAQHVNEGRAHLNFSEQPLDTLNPDLLIAMIRADLMPPHIYRLAHPEANLTAAQKEILIRSIRDTFVRATVLAAATDAPCGPEVVLASSQRQPDSPPHCRESRGNPAPVPSQTTGS